MEQCILVQPAPVFQWNPVRICGDLCCTKSHCYVCTLHQKSEMQFLQKTADWIELCCNAVTCVALHAVPCSWTWTHLVRNRFDLHCKRLVMIIPQQFLYCRHRLITARIYILMHCIAVVLTWNKWLYDHQNLLVTHRLEINGLYI